MWGNINVKAKNQIVVTTQKDNFNIIKILPHIYFRLLSGSSTSGKCGTRKKNNQKKQNLKFQVLKIHF